MSKTYSVILAALLSVVFVLGFTSQAMAKGGGIIFFGMGEELTTIEKFPADMEMTFDDGEPANLGIKYNQFELFWLPVWNYGDYQYVLVNEAEDTYAELDEDGLAVLRMMYSLPDKPVLPLATRIGLKPVIILLLGIYIIYTIRKPKEEDKKETTDDDSAQKNDDPEAQNDEMTDDSQSDFDKKDKDSVA